MLLRLLCVTLISLVCHSVSYALESSPIPFLSSEADYKIELSGDKALYTLLKKEIDKQRQTNLQLKQFTQRDKHARYESQLLTELLHAEGYYAAQVKFSLLAVCRACVRRTPLKNTIGINSH